MNDNGQYVNMADRTAILTAPNQICDKCGSYLFKEAYVLKEVSALISPTGQNELIPIPVWCCMECGEVAPAQRNNKNFKTIFLNKED